MKKTFQWFRILGLLIILFFVMVCAVSLGSADLSILDSLKIVASKIPFIGELIDISYIGTTYEIIIWKVRMPRIMLAALVGAILAVVGAAFQGVFGNSLADPHILGVSAGAAVGATLAMLFGVSINFLGLGGIGTFAFMGALIVAFMVYNVAKIGGDISTTNMLLTGTATSTMLSAIISLLMTFNQEQIDKVYMWTMGSFSAATWEKVSFVFVFALIGFVLLLLYAGKLNLMMMGEEDAKCLGVDTVRTRRNVIIIASLMVAAAVSISGIIGFVGLIIPNAIRMISGSDNKKLMPYAFIIGAIFLVICDTGARTLASPTEIPVGVITSIFGAPYFILLVLSRKKRG